MPIHVAGLAPLIQVFDMPTSIAFYRDKLGFTVASQSQSGDDCDWVLLKLDDAELMLNTAYEKEHRPAVPSPARIAAHEDTVLYFGCREVDGAYAHLLAHGVDAKPPKVAPYGMKQLYLKDPDGYLICFQWQVCLEAVGPRRPVGSETA
jgi:catechol 2,3-dioxygenase-like lactoylglutathione lyase family enzyme